MKNAKNFVIIALSSVLFSGYVNANNATANATQEGYVAAVADAKKSLKIANKANYEWRDSGKVLKQADKAAKAGDFSTATKLANQAKYQGDVALAQSRLYANSGPR